ncbi:MAG: AMP-binding protein [Burkholderiales bacterium]|nr:AMP-binding protein [Burkholderiales bacterium]
MAYERVGDLLDGIAARFADKDAFCIGSRRIGFDELRQASQELAKGLLAAGVRKGDRVAVWMGNCIEWPLVFYAAARMGAVLVPLSTRFKADEARYILEQCAASFIVLNDRFAGIDFVRLLDEVAPGLRSGGHCARLPALKAGICVATAGPLPAGLIGFEQLQAQGRAAPDATLAGAPALPQPGDPFLIQYTSGTTGFPKGAVLSQRNFARTGYEVGLRQQLTPDDRFFSPAPYFHVSGTMHALTAPLAHGCTVYSVEKYELEAVLQTISRNRCTAYHGFNFFKDYFAQRETFADRYDLSVLRRAWTTGTAVDMANIESLGIRVCNLYGLSETTGCSAMAVADDPETLRTRSVGRPLPGIEVCIQDRHRAGVRLAPGEEGEICIRGWNLMSGYFNKPEETAAAFDAQGWFHSGDLGSLDAQGYLRFLGRLKDIIRVGGENLSPLEVENLLRRHDKVAEACVVGVPDERLGEVCMAFVQLRPGNSAHEAEIVSFCRDHIAGYKVPRYVRFVDGFPMTGNNKIRRVEVKELARRSIGV